MELVFYVVCTESGSEAAKSGKRENFTYRITSIKAIISTIIHRWPITIISFNITIPLNANIMWYMYTSAREQPDQEPKRKKNI